MAGIGGSFSDFEHPAASAADKAETARASFVRGANMTTLLPPVANKATDGYGRGRVTLDHLWPSFPPDHILYEDADVVVIDKPVNVSTHAPDAGRSDDAVSRLSRAFSERDRVPADRVYLGIHQRLDRDTSGTLLFTRRKSANAAIAAQFEGRKVKKTYRAGVVGWPGKLKIGLLTHTLTSREECRMKLETPVPSCGVP